MISRTTRFQRDRCEIWNTQVSKEKTWTAEGQFAARTRSRHNAIVTVTESQKNYKFTTENPHNHNMILLQPDVSILSCCVVIVLVDHLANRRKQSSHKDLPTGSQTLSLSTVILAVVGSRVALLCQVLFYISFWLDVSSDSMGRWGRQPMVDTPWSRATSLSSWVSSEIK